ncbi:MAG: phage tail tape measure protein, partial [Marinomonas sp.]
MKQLEKLMLTIGLLDKVTKPMRGIQRTIQQVTSQSRKAFESTAAGVTALIGAAGTFMATVNPANDLNNALREVSSLDVADDTLKKLNEAGLQYSIEFGDSASNYVRSAYDIQSAIAGLTGDDLPRFTTAAGTLAKATKASVGDITSYVGTMYGIFQKQADQMGKGEWVEQLAGKTAAAVQMFKTTGPEMASAFESLGAGAQTMGVSLQEQMAVLGSLQATMSGSEAGTKYGAFLEGLAGAQSDLGLNFNDSSGNLLPVVDILQMIQGQMKGMNALEAQEFLSGAFDGEAVGFIQLMSQNIGKLNGDIAKLGEQTGMQKATDMANKMKDPWAQIASGIQAVFIAVTQKALPAIEPFIAYLVGVTSMMVAWTNEYPELTKWIALAGAALIGLIAVGGALSLAIGLARYSMVGMMVVTKLWQARTIIVTAAIWAKTAALWAMRTAMLAFVLYGPAVAAFFGILKTSVLTTLPAIWSFTAALLANPLTWIVIGVWALAAAIVGLIVYWDDITAATKAFFTFIADGFSNLLDGVVSFFKGIPSAISEFKNWITNIDWFGLIVLGAWAAIEGVMSAFTNLKGMVSGLLSGFVDFVWGAVSGFFGMIGAGWASIRAAFENNTWMKVVFAPFYVAFELIDALMGGLADGWQVLADWFASLTLEPNWNLGGELIDGLMQKWQGVKNWFASLTLVPSW